MSFSFKQYLQFFGLRLNVLNQSAKMPQNQKSEILHTGKCPRLSVSNTMFYLVEKGPSEKYVHQRSLHLVLRGVGTNKTNDRGEAVVCRSGVQ